MTTGPISAHAALVLEHRAPFRIEAVEVEAPRPTEVRVRMVGVGICHTDHIFRDADLFGLPVPSLLGHEGAGVVESVGSDISDLEPGDHVVLSFNSCGLCHNCRKHEPAYCDSFTGLNLSGGRIPDGTSAVHRGSERVNAAFFGQSSFATYAIASRRNAVKVDRAAPLDILGPLGCGVQTGAGAAINSLRIGEGDTLVIFGGGAVGLSALLGALAVNSGPVTVVEPNADRRRLALSLGAAHACDPKTSPDLLDELKACTGGSSTYVLDTTGRPELISMAAQLLAKNGALGLLGTPPMEGELRLSMLDILSRGFAVKGITEGDSDPQTFIPKLIDLHRAGKFPFDKLITRFPFSEINDAMNASLTGRVVKPVLTF